MDAMASIKTGQLIKAARRSIVSANASSLHTKRVKFGIHPSGCNRLALVLFAVIPWIIPAASAVGQECQGRCQYCVEGQCTPRRISWGHYQTNWRRWPEPAPPAPLCPQGDPDRSSADVRKDNFDADLELPTPIEETEQNPEFEHLRKRATTVTPPMQMDLGLEGAMGNGVMNSPPPSSPELPDESIDPFEDTIIPDTPLDLPNPDLEGRAIPKGRSLDRPAPRIGGRPPAPQRIGGRPPAKPQPPTAKPAGYFMESRERYNPLRPSQSFGQVDRPTMASPSIPSFETPAPQPVAQQTSHQQELPPHNPLR